MARSKLKDSSVYIYNAPYPGVVPGLPQELTGAEAKALGCEETLLMALANGTYIERRIVRKHEEESDGE